MAQPPTAQRPPMRRRWVEPAVDVALLIALTALGLVFSFRGGLVGLLAGYVLIGLRAPGARPWRRLFLAWLALVPLLALAYALYDFPGDEPPEPSVRLGLGVLLCVVLPVIVAAFGGGLVWFIRRWQGPDAAPASDDSGEGQGTGISPLVADILLLVALSAAGLFLGSIFDKAFLMSGTGDLSLGYIGASLGASLVFLRAGLQERPETLVRRVLGAWVAFSVVIIGTVLSIGLMLNHLSGSSSPPLSELLLFVAGSFAGVAIPALIGGGLAWLIRRWRPAKAPCAN